MILKRDQKDHSTNNEVVDLNQLAKERLSPRILRAIDKLTELRVEIQLNDDYLTLKANKKGISVDTSMTLTGLVVIVAVVAGGVWKFFF